MSSRPLSKDLVVACLVRAFFKYFALGVMEGAEGEAAGFEPRDIKQRMLGLYEKVSVIYNSEIFYALARMNFGEEEWEQRLRDFVKPGTTQMDLVRFACRTDGLYRCMVEEYRRNFTQLLAGSIPTAGTDGSYTRCDSPGTVGQELAEELVNRTARNAYEEGRKQAAAMR